MNLDRIVVGVGLSAPSLLAARWAATHIAPDARLVLVHCVEERWLPRFLDQDEFRGLAHAAREEAHEALQEFADQVGSERTEIVLKEGRPGKQILAVAEEESADLVVVGAHLRRPLVGSVFPDAASQLLAETRIPVLVAHGLPPGRPRRILVAVDESDVREKVLRWASDLGRDFDATGSVLHAIEPPGVGIGTTLFSDAGEYEKARARIVGAAEEWLDEVIETEGVDRERFDVDVAYGRPALEIVSAADRLGSELIIMGTRGRGLARAVALGSVVRGVLENSGCPVLVIPPERS